MKKSTDIRLTSSGTSGKIYHNRLSSKIFIYALLTHTLLQHPAKGVCDDANGVNGR
ncbi:MAG: hypothetical protein ACI4AH_03545 [Muribaculaceae bacterium]